MLTLTPFNELNGLCNEVNVTNENSSSTMYAVVSGDRLKLHMGRTKTGEPITSRELAAEAGVAHGTIGGLMAGTQRRVPEHKAQAIVDVLGIGLLNLFERVERDGRVFIPAQAAS